MPRRLSGRRGAGPTGGFACSSAENSCNQTAFDTFLQMEPASLDTPQTETKETGPPGWVGAHGAREGSLEQPEVLKDVPGHIIPILEREFDDFDTESTRYPKGGLEE